MIPALIRKMRRGEGAAPSRSCSGATARPRASSSTSTTAAEAICSAAERYDGAEPVNLGTGEEISIRDLAELVAELTGFTGEIAGTARSRTASRGAGSTSSRAEELFGFHAQTRLRDGLEQTIAWYRETKAVHAPA